MLVFVQRRAIQKNVQTLHFIQRQKQNENATKLFGYKIVCSLCSSLCSCKVRSQKCYASTTPFVLTAFLVGTLTHTNKRSALTTTTLNNTSKKTESHRDSVCHRGPLYFCGTAPNNKKTHPNPNSVATPNTQIHPPSQTMSMNEVKVSNVIVHPLVLLSVVDHFNRMGKIGNQKRVVGVLLGCWRQKGVLDVSNSFAGTNCDALQHGPFLRLTTNIVVVIFAYCLHIAQFPLTRTIRISRCGFSTTTTWTTCTACSRR